jgi:hypothetical protein
MCKVWLDAFSKFEGVSVGSPRFLGEKPRKGYMPVSAKKIPGRVVFLKGT